MKKVSTLLIGLFMTFTSFSQSFQKVAKAVAYSYINNEWVTDRTTYPETMYVIINGSEIKVTNKTESKYITYGYPKKENTSEYESNTWDAYDQDGDPCSFSMTRYYETEGYSIFVMYKRVAVQYIIAGK